MGYSSWNPADYTTRASSMAQETIQQVYSRSSAVQGQLLSNISVRESRDSEKNPKSTAIICAFDVSGSMGQIPYEFVKSGIGRFFNKALQEEFVSDPHLLVAAIGDIMWDQYPIQVTQFEADTVVIDQMRDLYLEGGGGGNSFESYDLAWLFAAQKCSCDCIEKRGEKGYLFTVGDERFPMKSSLQNLKDIGFNTQVSDPKEFLEMAQKNWHVFHLNIEQGWHASRYPREVKDSWKPLGTRLINVRDYSQLPEIMSFVIKLNEGTELESALNQYDESFRDNLKYAVANQ